VWRNPCSECAFVSIFSWIGFVNGYVGAFNFGRFILAVSRALDRKLCNREFRVLIEVGVRNGDMQRGTGCGER